LGAVQQESENERGTYGPYDLGHIIDLGEIFAHEWNESCVLPEFDELDRSARHIHCFHPANVRVEGAAQVVLIDLCFVERPRVVFVLANVKPAFAGWGRGLYAFLESRAHANVHPVAAESLRLRWTPTDAGDESRHAVMIQNGLETIDLALVDRVLREYHGIDTADLVPGGDNHATHQVEVELFRGRELKAPKGLLRQPLHGPLNGAEVGFSHSQRPGQQQEIDVVGLRIRAAVTGWQFMPQGLHAWTMHARVAWERAQRGSIGRGPDLGQHAQELWINPSKRSFSRQQFAATSAVDATLSIGPKGAAKSGAGLVGDGMSRQQGFGHAPVVAGRQMLQRHAGTLTKDPPFLG
jgi:hypothetical protein